jgi:hypothetical protein
MSAKLVQAERKTKIYLSFSEAQPNFELRMMLKVVQTEDNTFRVP